MSDNIFETLKRVDAIEIEIAKRKEELRKQKIALIQNLISEDRYDLLSVDMRRVRRYYTY